MYFRFAEHQRTNGALKSTYPSRPMTVTSRSRLAWEAIDADAVGLGVDYP